MKKIVLCSLLLSCSVVSYATDVISNDIVKAHNTWRKKVGSPDVTWSNHLQATAQTWAKTLQDKGCTLEHSPAKGIGENIYWASAHKTANSKDANGEWIWNNAVQTVTEQQVVDSWGSEQQWYQADSNECRAPTGKVCGHYTQVVWKKTTEVGCAKAVCEDSSQVWVCQYSPAGNVVGEKPY